MWTRAACYMDRILRWDLVWFVFGDILSTGAALAMGGIEINSGLHPIINPEFLLCSHPMIWPALMLILVVGILVVSGGLNKVYRNHIGILILVLPVVIESQAFVQNLQVISSLL